MTKMYYNPFMPKGRSFEKVIDDMLNRSIGELVGVDSIASNPAVNIFEAPQMFTIELAAPGLQKSDFEIKLEKNSLLISVNKNDEEREGETGNYKRREFNYSSFERSFKLPKTIDREKIEANYKNGVLSIRLMKLEEAIDKGPVQIDIK